MKAIELPQSILAKRAIIYVRQSTSIQVEENLESQRRQYELADLAKSYGFKDVVTIDEDLGKSASGTSVRPGFESLVAQLCQNTVGAVFCLEASRLARNGRDWHHLLELCGLVGARVADGEGIYDPGIPNDRLLLGLKGTMSEFELTVIRRRLIEAALAKAKRGELRIPVPIGYVWSQETGLEQSPDLRVQEAINTVFRYFEQLGSARQVLLRMHNESLLFPRPSDGKTLKKLEWRAPAYRNVISLLQNPFYAGAYAYGKTENRTELVNGRLSKTYGHERPLEAWTVLLKDHHQGYITWDKFERNQERLRANAYSKTAGGAKSGRGGRALLSGLLRCKRCGRMVQVVYSGRGIGQPRYTCRTGNAMHGLKPCITFGAARPDEMIVREVIGAVQPLAIEAAIKAEEKIRHRGSEKLRALELELQQADYNVQLAQRRYEAVDPSNRLVADQLEARWDKALKKLEECKSRIGVQENTPKQNIDPKFFENLAVDLNAAWRAPSSSMRIKQQLVRTLICEIVADVDDERREVIFIIHWHGGQHSECRIRKPQTGEHRNFTSEDADKIIREMAGKWSDEHIAATLNRMGLSTGQDNSFTAQKVGTYRRRSDIAGYESKNKDGKCLTMLEAATSAGVTCHTIRKLIKNGVLPAKQVMPDAPWQIYAADLEEPKVKEALSSRFKRPCRDFSDDQHPRFPGI